MAIFPGLPRWAGTRKVKPIWILLKQETVSGSGISWDICKSAPHSRQITTPAPHRSVFLQAGCPSCCPTVVSNWSIAYYSQPTASKHWRQKMCTVTTQKYKPCGLGLKAQLHVEKIAIKTMRGCCNICIFWTTYRMGQKVRPKSRAHNSLKS